MASILRYVVINRDQEWVSEEYEDKTLAIADAQQRELHAVLELEYEYSDSSLAWDPLGLDYWPPSDDEIPTYKIVRFWEDDRPSEIIETGLTLEEAQAHCNRDDTHGGEVGERWFDGFEQEED